MNKDIFHQTMQQILADKQLIEIYWLSESANNFKVGYVLAYNKDLIIFAMISPSGEFDGIQFDTPKNIRLFKTNAIYLSELSKKITNDSIYQRAQKDIQAIIGPTFKDCLTNLVGKKTLIDIACVEKENIIGRVVAFDQDTLVIDEYSVNSDRLFATVFIPLDIVDFFCLGLSLTETINRSLIDKNL